MDDPIRTTRDIHFSKLSELSRNMGDISAGTHRTGDDYGRQVIYGDDVNGLAGLDQYRKIYFRVSEVDDYWRVGIEGYPDAYWNPTDGLQLDGLALKTNSVTYDKLMVGPAAYGFLGSDALEFGIWSFSADSIYSAVSGVTNIELDTSAGWMTSYVEGGTNVYARFDNGSLTVHNDSEYTQRAATIYEFFDSVSGVLSQTVVYGSGGSLVIRDPDTVSPSVPGIILSDNVSARAWFERSQLVMESADSSAMALLGVSAATNGYMQLSLVTGDPLDACNLKFEQRQAWLNVPLVLQAHAEPADPSDGYAVLWMGTNGDVNVKSAVGADVRSAVLFDHSEA